MSLTLPLTLDEAKLSFDWAMPIDDGTGVLEDAGVANDSPECTGARAFVWTTVPPEQEK